MSGIWLFRLIEQLVPLPLTVVPRRREMAPSILSRLAGRNGVSVRQFCRDFRLRLARISCFEPEPIHGLSVLSGISIEDLLCWTMNPTTGFLGEHRLTTTNKPNGPVYGCPVCLRNEMRLNIGPFAQRAAIQGHWQLAEISVCSLHSTPLVRLWDTVKAPRRFEYDARLHEIYSLILSGDLDEPEQKPTSFELWFESRIDGNNGSGWLSTLPLFEASDFCLWLGQSISRSGNKQKALPSRAEAYDQGYSVASLGKDAVTAMLLDLQLSSTSPARSRVQVLGMLYSSFSTRARANARPALAAFMHEHIVSHWPIGQGDLCCGKLVKKRVLHSITSAACEMGVSKVVAGQMLAAVDRRFEGQNKDLNKVGLFPVDQVAEARKYAKEFVTEEIAHFEMGISKKEFRSICRDGLLEPVFFRAAKAKWSLWELDQYFDQVELKTSRVETLPDEPGWEQISDFCRLYRLRPAYVLELLRQGEFKSAISLVGRKRFEGLFLKPDSGWLRGIGYSIDGLTIPQFAKCIRIKRPIARKLVDDGVVATERLLRPGNSKARLFIPPEEVEQFRLRYVSIGRLCEIIDEPYSELKLRLQVSKIIPTSLGYRDEIPLMKWTEVEEKLFCQWPRKTP